MKMSSSRPYLVRALYEWIVDNNCTPYILVDASHKRVSVPLEYVNPEGQVVLNISPGAVQGLDMTDDFLSFSARFRGVSTEVFAPYSSILGIYAKENQQGMIFEPETEPDTDNDPPAKKPGLRVVK